MNWKAVLLWFSLFCLPVQVHSASYEVGPGKAYENVGEVPWEGMQAGDQVLIHWRPEPYREKWVIAVEGTEQQPFTVRGVANETGQLPVIDGNGATTRSQLNFWNEARGVIKIGGANQPPVDVPGWIILENLDIRSGRPPYHFTGRYGDTAYSSNAAALYVEVCLNLTIKNCILHDSGNGFFVSSASRNILIEGCHIYDNGIEGSYYQHNTYTEALGMVYQGNWFGPLRDGCGGNNLKDRSAGLVVRYNWIESGNRQLDLVDAEGSMELVKDPSYRRTYVYGNVLIEPEGAGNSQMVHYGGDSGDESIYRKGTLHFYHNTVVSTRSGNTTLLRLSSNDETSDCRNNIVWTSTGAGYLALMNAAGVLHLKNNWLKSEWVNSHGTLTGTIFDDGGNLSGDNPGFVDAAAQDFHLAPPSPGINAGASLAPGTSDVVRQYVKHQQTETRPADGSPDLGAFELSRGMGGLPPLWLLME